MQDLLQMFSGRWWIDGRYQRSLVHTLRQIEALSPEAVVELRERYAGAAPPAPTIVGDVAIIEASGPITYRASFLTRYLGWPTIEDLQAQFTAAFQDSSVRTVLVRWNSPGGISDMVKEFADWLYEAKGRSTKVVVSVADLMICSAAYWIAAQSDLIYGTESSQIGSIGVYMLHEDDSAYLEKLGIKLTFITYGAHKVEGNPYEPLSDEARARFQAEVDEVGGWFDAAVARGRQVTKKVVADSFGQGLVFSGPKAIELGLADKRGTWAQVVAKLTKGRGAGTGTAARSRAEVLADLHGQADDAATALRGLVIDPAAITAWLERQRRAEEDEDDTVDPNDDGTCPAGYEPDDEGRCRRSPTEAAASAAQDAQLEVDLLDMDCGISEAERRLRALGVTI